VRDANQSGGEPFRHGNESYRLWLANRVAELFLNRHSGSLVPLTVGATLIHLSDSATIQREGRKAMEISLCDSIKEAGQLARTNTLPAFNRARAVPWR